MEGIAYPTTLKLELISQLVHLQLFVRHPRIAVMLEVLVSRMTTVVPIIIHIRYLHSQRLLVVRTIQIVDDADPMRIGYPKRLIHKEDTVCKIKIPEQIMFQTVIQIRQDLETLRAERVRKLLVERVEEPVLVGTTEPVVVNEELWGILVVETQVVLVARVVPGARVLQVAQITRAIQVMLVTLATLATLATHTQQLNMVLRVEKIKKLLVDPVEEFVGVG